MIVALSVSEGSVCSVCFEPDHLVVGWTLIHAQCASRGCSVLLRGVDIFVLSPFGSWQPGHVLALWLFRLLFLLVVGISERL